MVSLYYWSCDRLLKLVFHMNLLKRMLQCHSGLPCSDFMPLLLVLKSPLFRSLLHLRNPDPRCLLWVLFDIILGCINWDYVRVSFVLLEEQGGSGGRQCNCSGKLRMLHSPPFSCWDFNCCWGWFSKSKGLAEGQLALWLIGKGHLCIFCHLKWHLGMCW